MILITDNAVNIGQLWLKLDLAHQKGCSIYILLGKQAIESVWEEQIFSEAHPAGDWMIVPLINIITGQSDNVVGRPYSITEHKSLC